MFSGIQYWALGIALTAALSFGFGWYKGETHAIKAATAQTNTLIAKAVKAQKDADDADLKKALADAAERATANKRTDAAVSVIFKDRVKLVPNPLKCKVPAASMKVLNDPALIGGGK